jgi:hypothetical protein
MKLYLGEKCLPADEKSARRLVLERSFFCLLDNILYRVMKDGTLRLVPPTEDRKTLYQEAHAGQF